MMEIEEQRSIEIRDSDKPWNWSKKELIRKGSMIACLVIVGLISIFILAPWASDPATYIGINETLDNKKSNVMALVATTTSASAAISLLPNGAGASISDKLADFSTYFMIILAVIYLEKFLLTTFGFISFAILVPAALLLFAISIVRREDSLAKKNLRQLATRILTFGVALIMVVPVSVWVTDNIDASFEASLQETNASAQAAIQEIEGSVQDSEDNQQEMGFFEGIANAIQGGIDTLTHGVQEALNSLGRELNNMVDTLAVMIVTSCLIPLIVLACFLQIAKMISGMDFGGVSSVMTSARSKSRSFISSLSEKS